MSNIDDEVKENATKTETTGEVEKKGNKKKKKDSLLKELFTDAVFLLAVFLLSFLFIKFVGQRTIVEGSSMESTLQDKDNLWIDKISYRFTNPKRFDVVVFLPYEEDKGNYYIKRIIGLPGETVQIDLDGTIYINGEILEEDYGREIIDPEHIYRAIDPVVLGEDEYFVMGDNRNNSVDSRFAVVGNVERSQLMGKAVFRFYPFSSWGTID